MIYGPVKKVKHFILRFAFLDNTIGEKITGIAKLKRNTVALFLTFYFSAFSLLRQELLNSCVLLFAGDVIVFCKVNSMMSCSFLGLTMFRLPFV